VVVLEQIIYIKKREKNQIFTLENVKFSRNFPSKTWRIPGNILEKRDLRTTSRGHKENKAPKL